MQSLDGSILSVEGSCETVNSSCVKSLSKWTYLRLKSRIVKQRVMKFESHDMSLMFTSMTSLTILMKEYILQGQCCYHLIIIIFPSSMNVHVSLHTQQFSRREVLICTSFIRSSGAGAAPDFQLCNSKFFQKTHRPVKSPQKQLGFLVIAVSTDGVACGLVKGFFRVTTFVRALWHGEWMLGYYPFPTYSIGPTGRYSLQLGEETYSRQHFRRQNKSRDGREKCCSSIYEIVVLYMIESTVLGQRGLKSTFPFDLYINPGRR